MVFVPIKYIYPSRTEPLRPLTVTLGIIWGVITIAMLPSLPSVNPVLLYLSLAYIAYYFDRIVRTPRARGDGASGLMSEIAKSADAASAPWLEIIDGDAPILLIAPHGGRAGQATRSLLNPKVNDLHTAAITRELSDASRCARADQRGDGSQPSRPQPAFAGQRERAVVSGNDPRAAARHRRAPWSCDDAGRPRMECHPGARRSGLGLRRHGDQLRPPGAARVSASDAFIHGSTRQPRHATRVRMESSPASGCAIPAAARKICCRHSPIDISRARSRRCANYPRWPRAIRSTRCNWSFRSQCGCPVNCADDASRASARYSMLRRNRMRHLERDGNLTVVRTPTPKASAAAKTASTHPRCRRASASSCSIHSAKIGAMASFDLGAGGVGARIMMLLSGGRVALFTGEGKPRREGNRLSLGPLALESQNGEMVLSFHGHAVIVPDATPLSQHRTRARIGMARRIDGRGDPAAAERGQRRDSTWNSSSKRATIPIVKARWRLSANSADRFASMVRIRNRRRRPQRAFIYRARSAALQLAPNDLGLLR